ncbi:hypothetical protein BJ912DRAFT_972144 [Pholiota molesta]|nr:hypothetical protein BJ912DRAFT_972144 [Pholiota molesta]
MKHIDCIGAKASRKEEYLASVMFYPPVDKCRQCKKALKSPSRIPIRYYMSTGHGFSVKRGYSSSLKCQGQCKIRYYPNYYSHNGLRHFYDSSIPSAIQIEDHAYVESELCEIFTSLMLFAWVSSQNCANIFNASTKQASNTSANSPDLSISSEQVFRAFVLHALLRDCSENKTNLVLPDVGDNDARLKSAMVIRNKRIMRDGQKEKMHGCNKCERFVEGTGYQNLGTLRAAVTDGDSIGRPCCKVHNCTTPLPTNRDHFCIDHAHLKSVCVVTGCTSIAPEGFQTCSTANHRAMEESRNERGKALFQLRKLSSLEGSLPEIEDGTNPDNTQDLATRKSDAGNTAPKARFARRRTHNEQLLVSCCGIILARGTMFGAEAISGVKDFLKSVYPSADDLPNIIFYDNNCHLQQHLAAQHDDFFKDIILPSIVTDEFCQRHCNPAMWPQLVDKDGKWIFNSSAAEQANAWLGGYTAIMIKRRNEISLERFRNAGHVSYHIPFHRSIAQTSGGAVCLTLIVNNVGSSNHQS